MVSTAISLQQRQELLAIRNWDSYSLDDHYFSEKTTPNLLNESLTTPTTQPNLYDPYHQLLDTAMEKLAQELEALKLIRDKRKELAQYHQRSMSFFIEVPRPYFFLFTEI